MGTVNTSKRVTHWLIGLATPPLLAVAQSPIGIAPISLIALAPWLWASRRSGPVEALALGALVGLLSGCVSAVWIPQALRSLGSPPSAALFALVLAAIWLKAPLFACAGWTFRGLRDRSAIVQIAAVAVGFTAGEWALGRPRLGVPWALVGHSQIGVPGVAQAAVAGGVPLLSCWVVAINAAITLALERRPQAGRLATALVSSWIVMVGVGLPLAEGLRPEARQPSRARLMVVQPAIPRDARWDSSAQSWILDEIATHTSAALARSPADVVIWPENLLTVPIDTDAALARSLNQHVGAWETPLIAGLVRPPVDRAPRRYRSSVVWIEPQRGITAAVDKFQAVPLLESSRSFAGSKWLTRLLGRAAGWPKVEEAGSAGTALPATFVMTPALCFEVLFPEIVESRRSPESVAILNLADESWAESAVASRQLADFASFRAIEQRITLIRLAHGGLSRVVDPFGVTRLELPAGQWADATVEVEDSPPPALREKLALVGLPLSTGWGVWFLIGAVPRAKRNRDKRSSHGTEREP